MSILGLFLFASQAHAAPLLRLLEKQRLAEKLAPLLLKNKVSVMPDGRVRVPSPLPCFHSPHG